MNKVKQSMAQLLQNAHLMAAGIRARLADLAKSGLDEARAKVRRDWIFVEKKERAMT